MAKTTADGSMDRLWEDSCLIMRLSKESSLGARIGLNEPHTPPYLGPSQTPHVSPWAKGQMCEPLRPASQFPFPTHHCLKVLTNFQERERDATTDPEREKHRQGHSAGTDWDRSPGVPEFL